jgi:TolB-like protein/DNA-binding winged helix-turn-helix (wHTH) protein
MRKQLSGNRSEISLKSDVQLGADRVFSNADHSLRDGDGLVIPLRRQSAEVLAMLISQKGRIVSKDELIDTVWKKAVVTDDSLSQCIADIRKALGDNGRQHLRTFPRKGYMLTVEPTLEHGSPVRSRNWAVLATLLVACLVAAWTFWPRTNALYPTVAVLAFDDLSAEPDRGYFSDAISEGVITELARFSEFETIARNSSFSFRDKAKDIREIGKILGATYILEGSQQKNGEALLVTAQLIDAKTGNHIWAETYSGEVADLFNVQGEIVRKIASTAGGQLSSYVSPQGHRGTVTAIHLNALGVEYMKSSTEEDVDRALPIFEQAVEADSASPWGYLGLGFYYRYKTTFAEDAETKAAYLQQAEQMAQQAVEREPENYLTHYLLARLLVQRGDMEAAILKFRQAIALNPSASNVLVGGSSAHLYIGENEQAIADIKRAMAIDPLHPDWYHWQMGWALWQVEDCDGAHQSFLRMNNVPPMAHRMWAAIHVCRGEIGIGRETLEVFFGVRPEATLTKERERDQDLWTASGALDRWLSDLKLAGMPE